MAISLLFYFIVTCCIFCENNKKSVMSTEVETSHFQPGNTLKTYHLPLRVLLLPRRRRVYTKKVDYPAFDDFYSKMG